MAEQQHRAVEEQELLEYLAAASELESARALEAAEFIRDEDADEAGQIEETAGGETQEAPVQLIADNAARRKYWEAQALIELEQVEFAAAVAEEDAARQRHAYYRLGAYHGRTLSILRSALDEHKEPLVQAAIRNLASLHRAMTQMHAPAPGVVPLTLVLARRGRDRLVRDLVVRALEENIEPADLESIVQRANALDVMGVARNAVQRHLKDLVASDHVLMVHDDPPCYVRTHRIYMGMDIDAFSLHALVGSERYEGLEKAGFVGLTDAVRSGTPGQLERFQVRTGSHPAVILMTYTALAQSGSGIGKGGFDVDSIEMFLQGANVQHVILDEVHKVAEDLNSVSSDVIRLMLEWLHDGSLRGVIGFTGTAETYRSRFAKLGLQLVYSIPIDELIGAGFVAPFAELGAPYAYSARERRIRELLDRYKAHMIDFLALVGVAHLRSWFAGIPMEERIAIGREFLNMYQGRKDWTSALPKRLKEWESGGGLQLTETKLVMIVQVAKQWTDVDLVREAGADEEAFRQLVVELNEIRADLAELIYLHSTLGRLRHPGYTDSLDVEALRRAHAAATNQVARREVVKDHLAGTIVGLYEGLSDWYWRVGEGRVETIKAVIEAERATRPVDGIIIFDNARRIQWKQGIAGQGVAVPGYEGLGGLYAQLLGDERFTPYAVLSGEQYLPYDEVDPLPPRIARFVEEELMQGEIARAMLDLVAQGLELSADTHERLRARWAGLIAGYIPALGKVHAARPRDFSLRVLRPMRAHIRRLALGPAGERLLSRLDLRNSHFADLVGTFFDYAIIARYFREAKVAELEQVSGARQKFFVVPMPAGNRKLLMYDLTSRIVDADSLPINVVVVSSWARTGWNVISPNVLIDATATRDVAAWQQLRGRAIRARRTWTNDCYYLMMALNESQMRPLTERGPVESGPEMPADVLDVMEQVGRDRADFVLDERMFAILAEVTSEEQRRLIRLRGLSALSQGERAATAVALMRRFNKVTHIYELIKAYGSTSQVEYDRSARSWRRRESIAAKHAYEVAVNPFSGEKSTGAEHAPLVFAEDPRTDVPVELQKHLIDALDRADDRIVAGWL